MKRLTAILFAAIAFLAACGSDDEPAMSGPPHNNADLAFARGMIPHHEEAIEMAKLAGTRAASQEVKDLAQRIEAAQEPEIRQMRGWLRAWGEEETAGDNEDMPGMDMGDGGGEEEMGMMSPEQMRELEAASGPAFDRMFLESMIKHHESAIKMAETEVADGEFVDAKQLATRIIEDQKAEIDEMRRLLAAAP